MLLLTLMKKSNQVSEAVLLGDEFVLTHRSCFKTLVVVAVCIESVVWRLLVVSVSCNGDVVVHREN